MAAAGRLRPTGLRCEYRVDPLGVEAARPRLSWVLEPADPSARGLRQTAFQLAWSTNRLAPDAWEKERAVSSIRNSDQMAQVLYEGPPLQDNQTCWWAVRVWDQDGAVSDWSPTASWTMGLLSSNSWKARWIAATPDGAGPGIGAAPGGEALPIFRREFTIDKPIRQALLHVCGLGFYEVHCNGQTVGDQVLDPGWTQYRKRCLYATHDVTRFLRRGVNALGVMLGNGMYNVTGGRYVKFKGSFGQPKLILQLHVQFDDGSTATILSDGAWRVTRGPILFSCIYGGEDYDARHEQAGWDETGFDDRTWAAAQEVAGPGGRLAAQSAPPIKVAKVLRPARVTAPAQGVVVYDLGRNFSGWPQVTVTGPPGAVVKLIPGELLDANGRVSQRSSGGPTSFSYTLRGKGRETWHPRFSYYGFRYVEVQGAGDALRPGPAGSAIIEELTGLFVHSSARVVGKFWCSDPMLNEVHALINAAILSNLQSVLTDCPHREKLGWLEVSQLLGPAIMYNYDVQPLYAKISDDMAESQLENGLVPDIAPEYTVFGGGFRDSPEWGSAVVINPWHLYQRYGDRQILRDHYNEMRRYAEYLGTRAEQDIVSHGLGDWYDVGPGAPGESKLTSRGLTATAIYYQDLDILRRVALEIGKPDEADHWKALAERVRRAFNARFYQAARHQYDRGSQTANAMPLALGLVDPGERPAVLENLVASVRAQGNHVTAGDVGYRFLVRALLEGNRSDVLFELATNPNPPGYVDQLNKGATTLTEAWDADPASSQNHCMLGHIEEWFYEGIAGMRPGPDLPGFRSIVIRPELVGNLTSAAASFESMSGRIESQGKVADGRLTLDVTIPPNTAATIHVPALEPGEVAESGQPAQQSPGVNFLRREAGRTVYKVGSGTYRFESAVGRR